jgi:hypothetical protein
MWRTFEAWDRFQMLLSDEIFLDAMTLPVFRSRFQMMATITIYGGLVAVKKMGVEVDRLRLSQCTSLTGLFGHLFHC